MIPKIIHYCWLSGDPYPDKIQYCIESWKKYLPDYEFILWDKNKFDINSCLWVKQAYEAKKYAFAADYIRLYALYHYGGIYLDSDVEVLKSFNPLLNQPYFFGTENNDNVSIEAATMGVEPHNSFIQKCLSYYQGRAFIVDGVMDMRTIPDIMMSFIDNYRIIFNEQEYDINASIMQFYAKEFFSPKDGTGGRISHLTKKTYSIHHYNASWYPKNKKFYVAIKGILGEQFAKYLSKIYKMIRIIR